MTVVAEPEARSSSETFLKVGSRPYAPPCWAWRSPFRPIARTTWTPSGISG